MEEMKQGLKDIVTQRLSGAPESAAKAELIEELAGNLLCRYNDLVAGGVEPEEAKARAVDALGDTDELVEYLKSLEPDQPLPELVLDPDKEDGGQIEEILHNVEDIIRGAFRKAKSTLKEAKDAVKEGFEAERSAGAHAGGGKEPLAEKEQKMAETEMAMNAKQQALEEAQEVLGELENARDSLESVSDQTIVEQALADLETKIGAKEAEIERLEREYEALEEEFSRLEEEFDELEAELDEQEAERDEGEAEKGWKVTYQNGPRNIEINAEDLKDSMKGMMKDIEKVIRDAADVAKDACNSAKEAVSKAGAHMGCGDPGEVVVADQPINAAQLRAIDVQTGGGDIKVKMTQAPDGDVLVGGDIGDIEVFRSEDGVLTIRPLKNETTSFFFGRGIVNRSYSADVELELPCRSWDSLKLATTNGDVEIDGDYPVDEVTVTSVSGDVWGRLPSCARLVCRTTNGDASWSGDASEVRIASVSGDVAFRGRADKVSAGTTSGDITLEGGICAASVKSISGDVCLRSDVVPDRIDMSTTSGDMWVDIPEGSSFTAKFRATSGEFTSDFFIGRMASRNAVFDYLGGGERIYTFGSISGDLELRKYH